MRQKIMQRIHDEDRIQQKQLLQEDLPPLRARTLVTKKALRTRKGHTNQILPPEEAILLQENLVHLEVLHQGAEAAAHQEGINISEPNMHHEKTNTTRIVFRNIYVYAFAELRLYRLGAFIF